MYFKYENNFLSLLYKQSLLVKIGIFGLLHVYLTTQVVIATVVGWLVVLGLTSI